ncbi:hypothetical protein B0H17DRAFT_1148562 [Mycena rosella]|uniref:Uncharacterized protein n=1 Tax=Mycena rosella TaxID=1033263 RepID=A0AAD7FXS0_MYCRO|nr:hypothetical protein B0H17DRAFT_1148562 [Mycena rosella]
MPPKSVFAFTDAQEKYIASFFPIFVAKREADSTQGTSFSQWKKKMITDIYKSPVFAEIKQTCDDAIVANDKSKTATGEASPDDASDVTATSKSKPSKTSENTGDTTLEKNWTQAKKLTPKPKTKPKKDVGGAGKGTEKRAAKDVPEGEPPAKKRVKATPAVADAEPAADGARRSARDRSAKVRVPIAPSVDASGQRIKPSWDYVAGQLHAASPRLPHTRTYRRNLYFHCPLAERDAHWHLGIRECWLRDFKMASPLHRFIPKVWVSAIPPVLRPW